MILWIREAETGREVHSVSGTDGSDARVIRHAQFWCDLYHTLTDVPAVAMQRTVWVESQARAWSHLLREARASAVQQDVRAAVQLMLDKYSNLRGG